MSKSAQVMLALALVVSLGWASGPTMLDAGLTRGPRPGGTLTELAPAPPPQAVAPATEQGRLPEPQTDQKTVLVVWADYDQGLYLRDTLQAYGHTVHAFDARYATPTVDTLSAYDAVITWSNYVYADNVTLGNNLATYVDGGGRVVIAMFAYASGWGLAGRIMTEAAYQTFPQGAYGFGVLSTNWLDPSHPITAGLSNISDYYRGQVYAASSATVLGTWSNGYDFCALSQNGEVVGITMHPGQAGNTYRQGPWGTLFHQAIEYSATTYTNDVGVLAIVEPGTYEPAGTPVTPEATVRNHGSAGQTGFDVVMEVDGVEFDRVTITTTLAPGSDTNVVFDDWTPGSNLSYLVEMFTTLTGDENTANDAKSVTVKTKEWVSIPPPTTTPHRVTHATCYDPVGDMLYMTGGCPAGQTGTNVTLHQRYDPVLQEWTDMAPMPDARGWIQSSVINGKIYVVGGYTNSATSSNTNYEYDIASNTWATRAPLTRSTLAHTQVAWNNQLLYVLGGLNAGLTGGVNNVDVYDPVANTWTAASPMPYMSDMYSATIVGDTIVIAQSYNRGGGACWPWLYKGGINPANPTQITWVQGPAMNPPVFNGGTVTLGGKVYWLGGFENTTTVTAKLWSYDFATNTIEETDFPYPSTIARNHFLVAREAAGELYCLAGDLAGNWSEPNNEYRMIVLGDAVNHDVGATGVTQPAGSIMVGTEVWPVVTVENFGEVEETFNVEVTIEDETDAIVFQEEEEVAALAVGESREVTFSTYSWTATPAGNYDVTVTTKLAGDVQPSNNAFGPEGFVVIDAVRDVGATAILRPAGNVVQNSEVLPRVTVENFGETVETFDVQVVIEDETDAVVYDELLEVAALAVGESRTVDFAVAWTASPLGAYTVTATTMLVGDIQPDNDQWGPQDFVVVDRLPYPDRWSERTRIPAALKEVKDGGWLAIDPATQLIYATKGNKQNVFFSYDAWGDSWSTLAPIPDGNEGKPPRKGSRGAADGLGSLYATKGNNTFGFWKYDIATDAWTQMPDVPAGAGKKVKGGTDLAYIEIEDVGYVYMMKGYKTEFYRFNTETGTWETLPNLPTTVKDKWDKGSWLSFDGEQGLYAHQAKYYNRTTEKHYMFRYDILTDSFREVAGMPLYGLHGGRLKKKKAKDGSSGAYYDGMIYALKGGNTQQFFGYDVAQDTWTELDTMPTFGSTGKKKRVKHGADIVSWGGGAFFALKGNKTNEFWSYMLPLAYGKRPERSGVMAGRTGAEPVGLTVSPNPFTRGFATLRYSLPKAGAAKVSVFDVTGRTVLSRSVVATRSGAVSLNVGELAAGTYLVRLEAEGYTGTQKLVVQR